MYNLILITYISLTFHACIVTAYKAHVFLHRQLQVSKAVVAIAKFYLSDTANHQIVGILSLLISYQLLLMFN